jgi:GntR family transcriptional regulator
MEFRESKPIYLQIADYVCEKILQQEWKPEERIPSVRELAILLEVNPNTVMRTYEFLQQKEIIYTERGVGLFVSSDATHTALSYRKEEFIQKEMPYFFKSMFLLQMEPEELGPLYKKFKKLSFVKSSKS